MRKFAIHNNSCLNWFMQNTQPSLKDKIISKYLGNNTSKNISKSTDINVLLNRVKTNQKNEVKKKLYFSAAASSGLLIFGLIIFS